MWMGIRVRAVRVIAGSVRAGKVMAGVRVRVRVGMKGFMWG